MELIVGILGILKSGGAYLPIDTSYPDERIIYMLTNANAHIVLTDNEHWLNQELNGIQFIDIRNKELFQLFPVDNLNAKSNSNDLAYVIYTSGSTGSPKGVMIEHKSVVRLVKHTNYISVSSKDRFLQAGSISFDAATFEIWAPLLNGASLYLIPSQDLLDVSAFKAHLSLYNISVLWNTSSWFNELVDADITLFKELRTLLVGGDTLSPFHINKVRDTYPELEIINGYGPTENTTFTTYLTIDKKYESNIPIGRPISNSKVYILGDAKQLQPIGIWGEICVSGDGLARGYLDNEALTLEKFQVNPHELTERLYFTGDIGRWQSDGTIEFLGRKDHQVKIRGFRIELGEIENRLLLYPGIRNSIVLMDENSSTDKYLSAYLVSEDKISIASLKDYLRQYLPDYMIPSNLIQVESIPLNPNGKVDKKHLSLLGGGIGLQEKEFIVARDDYERSIVAIWEQVLDKKPISIRDNFFEIGGHSLKGIRLVSQIYKQLGIKVELKTLFLHPTVEEMTSQLRKEKNGNYIPISKAAECDSYPLSYAQRRLWVLSQMEGGSTAYHMTGVYEFGGDFKKSAFMYSLDRVVSRHESLRSVFVSENGEPRQKVLSTSTLGFSIEDVDLRGRDDLNTRISSYKLREQNEAFDLERGPLLRAKLLQCSDSSYLFLFTMHHLISDGWSMEVLVKDVMRFYQNYLEGIEDDGIESLPIQYKDYAVWQQEELKSGKLEVHKQYWLTQLSGDLPVLDLALDRVRPSIKSYRGGLIKDRYSIELSEGLSTMSSVHGVTLYMLLLCGVKTLLHRYTGEKDLLIGSPMAGRDHSDLEDQIGFYVNTLVLRTQVTGEERFDELLEKVKGITLEAYSHQNYPFDLLLEDLSLPRDLSRNPVFDVMVVLQNRQGSKIERRKSDIGLSVEEEWRSSKFDMTFNFMEDVDGTIEVHLEYNTDIYDSWRMTGLLSHLRNLLNEVLRDARQVIGSIRLLTEEEEESLRRGIDLMINYTHEKTLVDVFEEQANVHGDRVAIRDGIVEMSYSQLNKMSNQLSYQFRELKGVTTDVLIGLLVERSSDMVLGMLGILKSGGGYLPIDPDYPQERILYMLEDSGVKLVLTDNSYWLSQNISGIEFIDIREKAIMGTYPDGNQVIERTSTSLAYVIYTSGSTGKPKGVMVEDGNVLSLLKSGSLPFSFNEQDVWSVFHSMCFDFSVWEIYGALLYGGKVVIVNKETARDPDLFSELLEDEGITVLNQTPGSFEHVSKEMQRKGYVFKALRYVIFGGEALQPGSLRLFKKSYPSVQLVNMYGITETTVHVTYKEIGEEEIALGRSNIGRSLDTLSVYMVDEKGNIVPRGVSGELVVRGYGVARGYLNRDELTRERFREEGGKVYYSGDLGRMLLNGDIEYLGRKDNQVKIRGHRIEIGEIESVILTYASVDQAVVIAKKDSTGNNVLVAYVLSEKSDVCVGLRSYMRTKLPDYMLPSYLVQLSEIPLTSNGKIDRKRLPEAVSEGLKVLDYVAPRNEMEELLAKIWGEVLGREKVGIRDNFFITGGDSIKAIQITSRLYRSGFKLALKEFYIYADIEHLAPLVKKTQHVIDQSLVMGQMPMTPIQSEYFGIMGDHMSHFNQSVMLYASDGFDENVTRDVFKAIQDHHDALRMNFEKTSTNEIIQVNKGLDYPFAFYVYDLREEQDDITKLENLTNELNNAIDLSAGPLMRIGLFKLRDGDRLLIVLNHLVVDGFSWRILFEDFGMLYEQILSKERITLPAKTTSYKRWAEELVRYSNSADQIAEVNYWAALERSAWSRISRDVESGSNFVSDIETVSFVLDRDKTNKLLFETSKAYNTEINDVLVTSLVKALSETFELKNILIGLESHGREDLNPEIDLGRTVGWFTTIYPSVFSIEGFDLPSLIKETKENLRRIPKKGIGYGILKYLSDKIHTQELKFNMTPQVIFNYLGQFDNDFQKTGFSIAKENAGKERSKEILRNCDLEIVGIVSNHALTLTIQFSKEQYNASTIARFGQFLETSLTEIIDLCASKTESEFTPSDFLYKKLSIPEIKTISEKYAIEDIYPLTPLQEGMFFHSQLNKGNPAYFVQLSYNLKGKLEVGIIQRCLEELFKRYHILRTVYVQNIDGLPLQLVLNEKSPAYIFEDISSINNKQDYIESFKQKDKIIGFDLAKDALVRVSVLKLSENEFQVVWSFHHIIMDGWCLSILNSDFFEIYHAISNGLEINLPAVKPYKHYLDWLSLRKEQIAIAFWDNYLEGYMQPAFVPVDKVSTDSTYDYKEFSFSIQGDLLDRVKELIGKENVTLNVFLQCVWGVLLSKYNNTTDVVYGTVVSGRPSEVDGIEAMVGLFINTVPVRVNYSGQNSFVELMRKVQEHFASSEEYQFSSLAEIQSRHNVKQDLINNLLIYENYPLASTIDGLNNENKKSSFSIVSSDAFDYTNYDFNVIASNNDELLHIKFNYNGNYFLEDSVIRIAGHFNKIISEIVEKRSSSIVNLSILPQEEIQLLKSLSVSRDRVYEKDKTIIDLFEARVQTHADVIAVTYGEDIITYAELNTISNKMGNYLRETCYIKPNDVVGLLINRSVNMISALVGVLKSGAAYLPMDYEYPDERIIYMLNDSNVRVVFTDTDYWLGQSTDRLKFVDVRDAGIFEHYSGNNLELVNQSSDLAYVIYTSGSTGKPKGVAIRHYSVHHLVTNLDEVIYRKYAANLRVALVAAYVFDASVQQIFASLLGGHSLYIVPNEVKRSGDLLCSFYELHRIDISDCTPAHIQLLLYSNGSKGLSLKNLIVGGDVLHKQSVKQLFNTIDNEQLLITNVYGPTECTVDSTFHVISSDSVFNTRSIPIGRPLSHTEIYIVDQNQNLQPMCVWGEIVIGGDGLAIGYMNNSDLTSDKFIDSPYETSSKIYLTGDIGRWLVDGTIEFLGRKDSQVKVRGFRIELGEIESRISSCEGIGNSVVIVHEDKSGDKYLIAYIVNNEHVSEPFLYAYMRSYLPEYMIPSEIIEVPIIPLNVNGKVDKKLLPLPGGKIRKSESYLLPRDDQEKTILKLWEDVLDRTEISIRDNFFEIGGHSIKLVKMFYKMNLLYPEIFTIVDLFNNPTIEAQSKWILSKQKINQNELNLIDF